MLNSSKTTWWGPAMQMYLNNCTYSLLSFMQFVMPNTSYTVTLRFLKVQLLKEIAFAMFPFRPCIKLAFLVYVRLFLHK